MNLLIAPVNTFDNDIGRFAQPHPDALDNDKCIELIDVIETLV